MGSAIKLAIFVYLSVFSNATIVRLNTRIYADFSISLEELVDKGTILKSFDAQTRRQCVLECISSASCKSVNFQKGNGTCELIGRSLAQSKPHLAERVGWVYLTTNEDDLDVSCSALKQPRRQRQVTSLSVAVLGGGQGGHGPRPRAFFDQKGPRKRGKNAKYSIDNVKYGHIEGL